MNNGPATVDLNGNTLARGYFSGVVQASQISPLDGSGYLLDAGGGVAIDWLNRELKDSNIHSTVDWGNMQLSCESGIDGVTVDWNFCFLFDIFEDISVDWNERQMYDGVFSTSLDWESRTLLDDLSGSSVDWNDRRLINSSAIITGDWERGTLNDPNIFAYNNVSVDWIGRTLGDTNGDIAYDWGNGILYDRLDPNAVSIDVAGRILWDTFGYEESLDWGQRALLGFEGLPTLNWGNQALVDVLSGGSTLTWIDPALTGVDSTPGFMAQQSLSGGNGGVGGIFFGNGAPLLQNGVSSGTLYVNCNPSGAGDRIYQWGGGAWTSIL